MGMSVGWKFPRISNWLLISGRHSDFNASQLASGRPIGLKAGSWVKIWSVQVAGGESEKPSRA